MKSSLRGELTNVSNDDRFNLTNNEMVIAIADHLKVTDNEDVRKISNTIAPVLMNCVASNVSLFPIHATFLLTKLILPIERFETSQKASQRGC